MSCCVNCFESNYLKQIIVGNATGDCDYCGSKDVAIYFPNELSLYFLGLMDLYSIDENGKLITDRFKEDFPDKIFSQKVVTNKNEFQLLVDILEDEKSDYEDLLKSPVTLKINNTNYKSDIVEPLNISWEKFCKEIKNVNRFHFNNVLDLDRLKSIFTNYGKPISQGKVFYRSRISKSAQPFGKEEMGNPPAWLSTNGRANPNGISYLYLSDSETTTLYEIRASLNDYVSVAKFKLKEEIKVINLSFLTIDIFTFADADFLEDILIYKDFIKRIEDELAKPHRRHDSELDYLPTQYISELIKSMGFDGIEYKSSLYKDGYNVAIFYPQKFECKNVKLFDIVDIDMNYKEISYQ